MGLRRRQLRSTGSRPLTSRRTSKPRSVSRSAPTVGRISRGSARSSPITGGRRLRASVLARTHTGAALARCRSITTSGPAAAHGARTRSTGTATAGATSTTSPTRRRPRRTTCGLRARLAIGRRRSSPTTTISRTSLGYSSSPRGTAPRQRKCSRRAARTSPVVMAGSPVFRGSRASAVTRGSSTTSSPSSRAFGLKLTDCFGGVPHARDGEHPARARGRPRAR